MKKKLDIFALSLFISLVFNVSVYAEVIRCEGYNEATKAKLLLDIKPVRSIGSTIRYLAATAKLGDRWLSYQVDVELIRTREGLIYRDRVFPKNFELKLNTQELPAHNVKAMLFLDKGMIFQSQYNDLTCHVEGGLLYPLTECPSPSSVSGELFRLVKSGSLRKIENLLGCGVDVLSVDSNSCSALHFATDLMCGTPRSDRVQIRGRGSLVEPELITLLVNAGVDVNLKDKYGNTSLLNATRSGQIETVDILMEQKIDLDYQDNFGNSAIMYAVMQGNELMIRTLLSGRPNLALLNNQKKTALDLARIYGHGYLEDILTPKPNQQHLVTGNADGTCSPRMIHLIRGEEVEVVLYPSLKIQVL